MRIFGFNIEFGESRIKTLENEVRSLQSNPGFAPSGWGPVYDSIFSSNQTITRQKALSVPAVFSAVDVVSKTLASIPFAPYRSTENGSEPAKGHPLWAMETIEPSPYTTSFNFKRDIFADACFGNAFAKISFKGNGRAYKIERLIPERVTVYQSNRGEIYYFHTNTLGETETLSRSEVIHLRGMSLDGWQGVDVSANFSASLAMSIDATRYGHNFFSNNAAIDKVVEYPGALTPAQRDIMERNIELKHSGIKNVGGTVVLDAGAKMTTIGIDPQKAMLNESRTFQAYESCRIFGVPAHMINVLDRSTFNNIEMMDNGFVKYCLAPWAEQFEAEMNVKLLTTDEKISGSIFHRFDLSGLMRGDMKSRGEYEDKMLKNMVYTVNDVRRLNNLNSVPWGDQPYAQAGVTQVNKDGSIDLNTPASDGSPAQAATDTNNEPNAN